MDEDERGTKMTKGDDVKDTSHYVHRRTIITGSEVLLPAESPGIASARRVADRPLTGRDAQSGRRAQTESVLHRLRLQRSAGQVRLEAGLRRIAELLVRLPNAGGSSRLELQELRERAVEAGGRGCRREQVVARARTRHARGARVRVAARALSPDRPEAGRTTHRRLLLLLLLL